MVQRVILAVSFFSFALLGVAANPGISPDGLLDEAQRHFRAAELAEPRSRLREVAYAKVETLAEQVIASDPRNADAHFLLFAAQGRRLLLEGGKPSMTNFWKYAGVNRHLDRALELNPQHAKALAAKGGILLDLPPALGGDRTEARQLLERAVELNPTGMGTRVALARALLLAGEREPARQHLLLAAHYACVKHEAAPLMQAESLLSELTAGTL